MSNLIPIRNQPNAEHLWKGIAGHFDSFDQVLCEFIDNAISNFAANRTLSDSVVLRIREQGDKSVIVSIEDSGTGIKDLDSAFELGNVLGKETPLNEHGFGLKHALASANPANTDWQILTRTKEDFTASQYKRIAAPYKIADFNAEVIRTADEPWPGDLNGPGTLVTFHASKELFNTLRKGISGPVPLFSTLIEILAEDLGFIYAGLISENKATIRIVAIDQSGQETQRNVTAVEPDWQQFYKPYQGVDTNADLGGGKVQIKYSFGEMKQSVYRKYYKRNMSSSGLEIRLNVSVA